MNPEAFVKSADEAVKQIEKVDYLNLLLTSLKTETIPEISFVLTQDEHKAATDYMNVVKHQKSKIMLISECIRNALQKLDKYRNSSLSISFICIGINTS